MTSPAQSFTNWAADNIPPGTDASFGGSSGNDGIPNGIRYAFANAPIKSPELGAITSPADVPVDVILILKHTENLETWAPVVTWTDGIPVIADPANVSIESGFVTHTKTAIQSYWRSQVNLVQP